jgi:hypothetical protein
MRFILSVLFFIPLIAFTQGRTIEEKKNMPFYIETCVDKMTDKAYAFSSKGLMCSEDGDKGFFITADFQFKNGKVIYNGLSLKSAKIGNCVEKSNLIFLFEDDTKFQLTAWNDFNCDGKSWFDYGGRSFDKLVHKKIKAIRFQNGRTFDSYTYPLTDSDKLYFLEVGTAVAEQRIEQTSCDD